ncbi:MAG TPA: hypothetical protein PK916_09085 [Bacteroidota bacterium]|nr:hypothetical protein [Bacteroidota bacterium]
MILHTLSLRGWKGIHDNTGLDEIFIDFDALQPGLVAIVGDNGFGKSTTLENMHLYRRLVTRDGKLADHCRLRDSHRILTCTIGGEKYEARILIDSKSGDEKRYITRNGEPLNPDGKADGYDRIARELCGSETLFFNSSFRAQSAPSFAELSEKEGKALFLELIGEDQYPRYARIASEKRRAAVAKLEDVRLRIETLKETSGNPDVIQACIDSLNERALNFDAEIHLLKTQEETANKELGDAQVKLALFDERGAEFNKLFAEVGRRDTLLRELHAELDTIKTRVATSVNDLQSIVTYNQRILDNVGLVRQRVEEIVELRARRDALLETGRQYQEKWRSNYAEKNEDEQRMRALREDADDIRREHDYAQERLAQWNQSCDQKLNALDAKIADVHRQAMLLDQVPCKDTDFPNTCQLLSHATEAAKSEEMLGEQRVNLLNEQTETANTQARHIDELAEKARIAEVAHDDWLHAMRDRDTARNEALNAIGYDPNAMDTLLAELTKLESERWEELQEKSKNAEIEKQAAERRIVEINADMELQTTRILAQAQREEQETAELQERMRVLQEELRERTEYVAKIDRLANELSTTRLRLQQLRDDSTRNASQLAVEQENLVRAKELGTKVAALEIEAAVHETEAQEWAIVEEAVGLDGIQAMEINAAGPEVSEEANDLLSVFGSPFRVRIDTARPDAKGKRMLPDFRITVLRDGEERAFKLVSGGQRVWIDAAMTQAIALYRKRKGNLDIRTTFLDEADGALSPENAPRYLRMLQRVHDLSGAHFTFIITHRPELIAMMPQRIEFTKSGPQIVIQ